MQKSIAHLKAAEFADGSALALLLALTRADVVGRRNDQLVLAVDRWLEAGAVCARSGYLPPFRR